MWLQWQPRSSVISAGPKDKNGEGQTERRRTDVFTMRSDLRAKVNSLTRYERFSKVIIESFLNVLNLYFLFVLFLYLSNEVTLFTGSNGNTLLR